MTGVAHLLSIQVGRVRSYPPPGPAGGLDRPWTSAFIKLPVSGPLRLDLAGLEGDEHADARSHGGHQRALLGYSADHYPRWREELGLADMGPGGFGENLTVSGLDERTACIGDVYRIGEARIEISQPRSPCANISRRWGRPDLMDQASKLRRIGWYLRVLEPGLVEAGVDLPLIDRPFPEWTVERAYGLRLDPDSDPDAVAQLAGCLALSADWRGRFARLVPPRSGGPA